MQENRRPLLHTLPALHIMPPGAHHARYKLIRYCEGGCGQVVFALNRASLYYSLRSASEYRENLYCQFGRLLLRGDIRFVRNYR